MASTSRKRVAIILIVAMALLVLLLPSVALAKSHKGYVGAVFVQTNAVPNEVAMFQRKANGSLKAGVMFATGGDGTGAGLGSQGALALSKNGKWLLAVNAGSDDLTVFKVSKRGLTWVDKVSTEGTMPVSVTTNGRWVYVLNAGGSGNIAGFRMDIHGHLTPVPGSVRPLSNMGIGAAPVAQQIGFNPRGNALVVTELSTNMIDTYMVSGGVASMPVVHASNGAGPYGFDFTKRGKLIVSEAPIGALSSYNVTGASLSVISPSVPDFQSAPCWVVVSPDSRYAYTADAHSNDISIYKVRPSGALTLAQSAAVTVGTPLDLDLSHNGRFLYALSAGSHNIAAFRVRAHGSLKGLGSFGTLPSSAAGLVAW